METYINFKKDRARVKREFKKIIESQLHPNPVINGITICHRHVGQKIHFSAWDGEKPLDNHVSEIIYDRNYIGCYEGNFYKNPDVKKEFLLLLNP